MWTALTARLDAALGGPEGRGTPACSPARFALFRVLLGLFLVRHFLVLLPWAEQLYSREGALEDTEALFWIVFPGALQAFDAPWMVQAFLLASAGLAVAFTLGLWRPQVALLLWYALASLAARNFFTYNLSWSFLGWLLLACALVPGGEPWSLDTRRGRGRDRAWALPATLYWGGWAIVSLAYTVSGLSKLGTAQWLAGSAVVDTATSGVGLSWAGTELLLALPPPLQRLLTWGVLAAELLAAPLALHRRTRPVAWASLVAVHLGILCTVRLWELSVAMLLVHLLLFDARWLPRRAG